MPTANQNKGACFVFNFAQYFITQTLNAAEEGNERVFKYLKKFPDVLAKFTQNQTVLDLSSHAIKFSDFKEKEAGDLVKALEGNTTVTSLNLSGNNLGLSGIEYLGNTLNLNVTLTLIDLTACYWNERERQYHVCPSDAAKQKTDDLIKRNKLFVPFLGCSGSILYLRSVAFPLNVIKGIAETMGIPLDSYEIVLRNEVKKIEQLKEIHDQFSESYRSELPFESWLIMVKQSYKEAQNKGETRSPGAWLKPNTFDPSKLGAWYYHGQGLPQSYTKALEMFTEGAARGNAEAEYVLGLMHLKGQGGLPKSDEQAVAWWTKAAAKGSPNAEFMLGLMHHKGQGDLPQSDEQAVAWWTKAAAKGQVNAINNLGHMYKEGRGGLPQSEEKALELWKQAAAKGHARAIALLK